MQLRHRNSRTAAISLMEVLVVIAIVVVVSTIAYPIYRHFKLKGAKTKGLVILKQLGEGLLTYVDSGNAGILPLEDAAGSDNWTKVKTADKTWYNAVPKHLGKPNVADFSSQNRTAAFYTEENMFFLPGAQYPEKKRMEKPLFAVAYNSKIAKNAPDGTYVPVKKADILLPARTVMFVERGLPGETRAHESMDKNDYDGAPKGTAKAFVARYSGKLGCIVMFDGSVEEVKAETMLTPTGAYVWTAGDPAGIFWTADPKTDPNAKDPAKKKKP